MKLKAGDNIFSAISVENFVDFVAENMGERGVVIYFYPRANTSGCTKEALSFQKLLDAFEDEGFNVIGVSTDSEASQKKFAEKYNLRFPMFADTTKEVAREFGVLKENGKSALRQTVLIDDKGKILKVWEHIKEAISHPKDVLDFIISELHPNG